jgi:hypothetical protein
MAQEKKDSATKEKAVEVKPRKTREEILEQKVSMAKERNSRVARIDSTLGSTMFNIMRQFDQSYAKLKGSMGEFGGTSHDKGIVYMQRAHEITLQFSALANELSKEVGFKYYVPRELQDFLSHEAEAKDAKAAEKE